MLASRLSLILPITLIASTASAGDFVVGLGQTDFDMGNISVVEFEYHTDPVWQFAGADVSVMGVVTGHDNGDFFVGGGFSTVYPLKNDWFIEASFAPGYYGNAEDATDLGNDLEFRTLFGLGRTLSNGNKVSLALSHKSNAGLGDSNPGVNAFTLRFRF